MGKSLISGIMQRMNLCAFMISSISAEGDIGEIFRRFAENQINIEFINQIRDKNGYNNVMLCVDNKDAVSVLALLEELRPVINAGNIFPLNRVGILSMFPHRERVQISSIIIQTLAGAKIPLFAVGNSISVISCVINEEHVSKAIKLLGSEFGLT